MPGTQRWQAARAVQAKAFGDLRRHGLDPDSQPAAPGGAELAELVHELGEDDEWREMYRSVACRYTPERFADAYLADTIEEPRALFRLVLAGSEVATWRMPIVDRGEDPLAVWSKQYYHRS